MKMNRVFARRKNCNARELSKFGPDARLGEGLRFTVELGDAAVQTPKGQRIELTDKLETLLDSSLLQ